MSSDWYGATDPERLAARRMLKLGLGGVLVAALASGPGALLVVGSMHPQPRWSDVETFAASYHAIQILPFVLGLPLVASFIVVIASLHCLASAPERPRTTAALLFGAAFATLVLFNYLLQTTMVPLLARPWSPGHGPLLETLTMSNPRSVAWALEMWGYGLLGAATWLCGPVLAGQSRSSKVAGWCFIANGPISIAGALATMIGRDWLLSATGLWAFAGWNLLVILMAAIGLFSARHRPVQAR